LRLPSFSVLLRIICCYCYGISFAGLFFIVASVAAGLSRLIQLHLLALRLLAFVSGRLHFVVASAAAAAIALASAASAFVVASAAAAAIAFA
jgi:hypothetical protein